MDESAKSEYVAKVAARHRDAVLRRVARAHLVRDRLSADIEAIDTMVEQVDRDVERVNREIRKYMSKLMDRLRRRKRVLISEVHSSRDSLCSNLMLRRQKLDEILRSTLATISRAEEITSGSSDVQVLLWGKQLVDHLSIVSTASWDPIPAFTMPRAAGTDSSEGSTGSHDLLSAGVIKFNPPQGTDIMAIDDMGKVLMMPFKSPSGTSSSNFSGSGSGSGSEGGHPSYSDSRDTAGAVPPPRRTSMSVVAQLPLYVMRDLSKIGLSVRRVGSFERERHFHRKFSLPRSIAVSRMAILRVAPTESGSSSGGSSTGPSLTKPSSARSNIVVVGDTNNHRIQVLDTLSGRLVRVIGGSEGRGNGKLSFPEGVALVEPYAKQSRLLLAVTDSGNNRVQVFDAHTWDFVYQFTHQYMGCPAGVAVLPGTGHIVVCNRTTHCVTIHQGGDGKGNMPRNLTYSSSSESEYASDDDEIVDNLPGAMLKTIGLMDGEVSEEGGSQEAQFHQPCGVAVNSHGHIIVADSDNHRIQVFDSLERGCQYLFRFGNRGTRDGEFNGPCAVAVDSYDNMYVCDLHNNRVQIFKSDGQWIQTFGSEGDADGQFRFPHGIAVDPTTGEVHVVDEYAHCIQIF
eukprot:TRINITY_DN6521_c0_g1_i1.p1 TRINITY_DN6521_c0_g1~~TRINITY_DN6521_c0_g1_i1.p1  ORF type:complete len:645 (+),score=120.01 TRINITY_DN6521_c0_g1_i1:59-1936(+)